MNETSLDTNVTFWPPPPIALKSWPGCDYPKPLPAPGIYQKMYVYIWYIFPVFHVVFGTFGNLMTALIIVRNIRKITSTSVMLLALAVGDTICLYDGVLRNWFYFVWKIDIRGFTDIGCKVGILFLFVSYQSSVWFLVTLTAERFVCIVQPHKVKLYFTVRNTAVAVLVISFFFVALNCHVFYGFGVGNIVPGVCLVIRPDYSDFYDFYSHWMHFAVGYLIPAVIIVIGNCMIIQKARVSLKRKDTYAKEAVSQRQSSSSQRYSRQGNSLTVMLILLSAVFVISQTPITVFFMIEAYVIQDANEYACVNFPEYIQRAEKIKFAEALCLNFGYLNASINFVLYVISGRRFREDFRAMLLCRRNVRTHTVFTVTDTSQQSFQQEKQPPLS